MSPIISATAGLPRKSSVNIRICPPAEVHVALGYYFDHRDEIDAELSEELAELDRMARQPPSPLRLRVLALRQGGVVATL